MSLLSLLGWSVLLLAVAYVAASYGPEICQKIAPLKCLKDMMSGSKKAGAPLPAPRPSMEERFIEDALENTETADLEDVSRAMRKRINNMLSTERVAGAAAPKVVRSTYSTTYSSRDPNCVTGANAKFGSPISLNALKCMTEAYDKKHHCVPHSENESNWAPHDLCRKSA